MAEGELNKNKGTSKRLKTDENSTHFAVHISPSLFLNYKQLSYYTQHPFKNAVVYYTTLQPKIYIFISLYRYHF